MQRGLLLNIIVGKSPTIFKLFASEDQALLIGRNAFLILNLRFHVVDGVGGLDLKGDSLARQRLDEDLHATTETEDQMKGRFLLDVVVGKSAPILKLLASEDQALLVRRNTFLVLDLGLYHEHECRSSKYDGESVYLDVIDSIRRLNLKSNSLASQSLDKDLHAATQTKDKVESGLLLNVVVRKRTAVFELLSSKDETLLVRRNALLVLDLGLE